MTASSEVGSEQEADAEQPVHERYDPRPFEGGEDRYEQRGGGGAEREGDVGHVPILTPPDWE
jgi:hypothetical protein